MLRPKFLPTIWLAAIFLLAACSAAPTQPPAEGAAPAVPSPTAERIIETEPAEAPVTAEDPAPATLAPTTAAASPAAPTESEVREVRAELHASDPGAFQVASGDVQLVEFFAFW